jgi:hypothetical protein
MRDMNNISHSVMFIIISFVVYIILYYHILHITYYTKLKHTKGESS